ncbi:MAG TPA: hypothetical protein VGL93_17915 [Streptosporangiaceae bacterium]|jgi:hypothetical protein
MANPAKVPERKVSASTVAAAVAGLVIWLLGRYVFKGTVPDPVVLVVNVLMPGVLAFVAGYFTRHTHRPDLGDAANG